MSDGLGGVHDPVASLLVAKSSPPFRRLQKYLSAVRGNLQVHLVSFNQWELSVELRPRPLCNEPSEELESLKLKVSWGHRDTFTLQVVTTHCRLRTLLTA